MPVNVAQEGEVGNRKFSGEDGFEKWRWYAML